MTVYYVCPTCQTKNEEHKSYCDKCGTWLLSTAYPAKRIDTKKRASQGIGGSLIAIIVIGAVIYFGFAGQGSTPAGGTFSFDEMQIGANYTISQFVVDPKDPSATADLTAIAESKDPIEVAAVFYDNAGQRLGKATSLITKPIAAGQTTTISFSFDEANGLDKINQVRIEISPLSPLMLLERAADKVQSLTTE